MNNDKQLTDTQKPNFYLIQFNLNDLLFCHFVFDKMLQDVIWESLENQCIKEEDSEVTGNNLSL